VDGGYIGDASVGRSSVAGGGLPVLPTLITAGDIQRGKPDPDPIRKLRPGLAFLLPNALCRRRARRIRAGKAAGARVIGFPTTSNRHELEIAGTDWVVRNCADIAATFDGTAWFSLLAAESDH